jgi:nucleoside-diphosphate-sugar epimerase
VLKRLGRQLPSKKKPFWLVSMFARLMELRSKLTDNREPPLTLYGVGTLSKSFTLSIGKAKQLLGYEPAMTVDEAIDEFVKWYLEHEDS